jgi:hypothetical protein
MIPTYENSDNPRGGEIGLSAARMEGFVALAQRITKGITTGITTGIARLRALENDHSCES